MVRKTGAKSKAPLKKLTATQILIAALVIAFLVMVILSSLQQNQQEIIPQTDEIIIDLNELPITTPAPHLSDFLSAEPNPEFSDVNFNPNYRGDAPEPGRHQLMARQNAIENAQALHPIADEGLRQALYDAIVGHFQENQPDFLYGLVVVNNSVDYDPMLNQGRLSLAVVNHDGTTPTLFYIIYYQIEPLILVFEPQS